MNNQITTYQQELAHRDNINTAIWLLIESLTETSKRQYEHTFRLWIAYAQNKGFHPLELAAENVLGFLNNDDLSKSTKQARLTHLRRLAQTSHAGDIANIQFEQNYKQLQLVKIKGDNTSNHRNKKALEPDEIFKAFDKWSVDTALGKRNRALLAILFYAGVRRSELVALTWNDLDLQNGLITIQHGKGDKSRTIPFASDRAIRYLTEWKVAIGDDRSYVFPAIRKGGHIQHDKPMTTNAVWKITNELGFAPHDARRTLLTRSLSSGTSVSDAQFIAGHVNGQTTLRYAVVKDAKEVKGRVKLDY